MGFGLGVRKIWGCVGIRVVESWGLRLHLELELGLELGL